MSRSVYAKRLCSQRRPGMKRLHQRGAAVPFGESHIMEHGLLMLAAAVHLSAGCGRVSRAKLVMLSGWRVIALNGLMLWAIPRQLRLL